MVETVYSREQIDDWQSALKDFAKTPRTQFTKRQVVEAMMSEIEEALKNHSYAEISEKLIDSGLDVSRGTLQQYVNAYRREHTSAKSKRRQSASVKKKAVAPATASSQAAKNQTAPEVIEKKATSKKSPATKKATSRAK